MKHGRSRLANDASLLLDVDMRSALGKRFKDIVRAVLMDQGGPERCAEARTQLVRRFAAQCVMAERLEMKMANGEAIDVLEHCQLTSTLTRVASRIGINRAMKTLPSLSEYIAKAGKIEIDVEGDT
jgi:hypothetical protein